MTDCSDLMRRAEELATDINTEMKTGDYDSTDHLLIEKALAHIITGGLLLKGTTAEFKAEMEGKNSG